ncbi:hypothetical protein FVEG_16090 [Fusarium verticillioides 7600]|uniref:Uncharacterized protein n=1 Tax=Gibberella moniliformis (strain M3125 / FGSC 7600) TaxID=334819 RepID=W7MRK4_GIBM7|nr:hypothetical protein FVEG_16090 [Fusarium verticillioides 7600]EWG47237.1 hypothetical protein FVEG_16090 [Fusarium verticillioides 7600]
MSGCARVPCPWFRSGSTIKGSLELLFGQKHKPRVPKWDFPWETRPMNDRAFRKVHQALTKPLYAPNHQTSLIINYHTTEYVCNGRSWICSRQGAINNFMARPGLGCCSSLSQAIPCHSTLKIIIGVCLSSSSGRDVISESGLAEV